MTLNKLKIIIVPFLFLLLISLSTSTITSATTTLEVVENDLVKLVPTAIDPDGDKITFYYESPFNENGEWQTTLDDEGTYLTKIIASDGVSQNEEEVTLLVKNKNQPPQIKNNKLTVYEQETVDLKPLASDPDGDELKYIFEEPFDEEGTWTPSYKDEGLHKTKLTISDLEYKDQAEIEIEVLNKNQAPELISSFSEEEQLNLIEDSTHEFYAVVEDSDEEDLSFTWMLDGEVISEKESFPYHFDFSSAGEHTLTLIASDQQTELTSSWILSVENINRAPEINHPEIIVSEGEKVSFQLSQLDIDGDIITYTFEEPFNEKGEWQTTYLDSRESTTKIIATDGELTVEKEIPIIIKDVDLAPEINLAEELFFNEGEETSLELEITDPDEDDLFITIENLPLGASLDENTLEWTPDFNYVQRQPNFITNFLNKLRLDKFIFKAESSLITVHACGKDLCTSKEIKLIVNDVNQAPVIEPLGPLTLTETETVSLEPFAIDPDQDFLTYTFSAPLNQKGEWKTTYEDEGTYNLTVIVSDGFLSTEQIIEVNVLKNNRLPTLKVSKDYYKLNEGEQLQFSVSTEDPDNDYLELTAENLPQGASFTNGIFSWTPSFETTAGIEGVGESKWFEWSSWLNKKFNDEAEHLRIDFTSTDGDFIVKHPVVITVKNINLAPRIGSPTPAKEIFAEVNKPVDFHFDLEDPDQDLLVFEWSFNSWEEEAIDGPILKRTFVSPGTKTIKVKATDGMYETEYEWKVRVTAPEKITPSLPQPTEGDYKVYIIEH